MIITKCKRYVITAAVYVLVICMLLSLFPVSAAAYTVANGTWGGNLSWTLDSNGTLTISGTGAMAEESPETHRFVPWRDIHSRVINVVLTDGVTSICAYAFWGLSMLETVTIPSSVTDIGEGAFLADPSLTDVVIEGDGLEKIGAYAFEDCEKLERIPIPKSLTEIGGYAFHGCRRLISIDPLWNVSVIGEYAFADSALAEIMLWGPITEIAEGAFNNCRFYDLVIPDCVETIGAYAFSGCDWLRELTLPQTLISIREGAFSGCDDLTSIELPDGVRNIGKSAFKDCTSLKYVYIPDSIESASDYLFSGCSDELFVYIKGTRAQWIQAGGGVERYMIFGTRDVSPTPPLVISPDMEESRLSMFSYASSVGCEYYFEYDDTWFTVNSYDYADATKGTEWSQKSDMYCDMLKTSLKAAMAAFMGDSYGYTNHTNVDTMMEQCGYTNHLCVYPIPGDNTIGYHICHKEVITDDGHCFTVIAVAIRGGGYLDEWAGNFTVGNGMLHEGFNTAATELIEGYDGYMGLREYIDFYSDLLADDIKVWVTGYSRAAATANLVGKYLIDGAIDRIEPENVYTFCYECPQTTRDAAGASNPRYRNIISIVNPIDFVTKVPLSSGWGYTRYGTTFYLPSRAFNAEYGSDLYPRMLQKYYEIANYDPYDNYIDYDMEVIKPLTLDELGQYYILESFMDALAEQIPTTEVYCSDYQETMIHVARQYLGSGDNFVSSMHLYLLDVLGRLSPVAVRHPIITLAVTTTFQPFQIDSEYNTYNVSPGAVAHYPELCLAWLEALDGLVWNNPAPARKVFINCPVDVLVYDSNGVVVGQITDDVPVEIENGIITYCDDDGQKILILPGDEEYSIEITATDDGTLTYTATEYDIDSGDTVKLISYHEIEITEGMELTGLAEDLDDTLAAQYPLLMDDTSISPDEIISGDVDEFTVTVETEGDGTVIGGGKYLPGEYASLKVGESQETFSGWYCGEQLLSVDTEYRFMVSGDITITARFGESCAYGDANGDGSVDSKDIVLLKRYLANYDYDSGTSTVQIGQCADANGDGKADSKDIVLLKRYLANYDYDTGTSTVTLGPTN